MYNKISPIILNSGKANGVSDVFISQPDALKENLAGKIFVLAEIEGRKNDSRKILDFLISNLEDYYYNDEKIVLRDKIEGLKIENIFEAALAKTNKALVDFLNHEKIKLNSAGTNITLGVIFENKLHFSNYGKNRSLLVFPRQQKYEVVNIEANATDSGEDQVDEEVSKTKVPKLFSSIINGEIPENAYFVFTSETLPEYLSDKEMLEIITKLPPIVAAEQIKNTLAKINSYVPFLGIIIKNTIGTRIEKHEEPVDSLSAQNSISALNYTEQKTEKMLSPAGLIDLRKVVRKSTSFLNKFSPNKPETSKRPVKRETKQEELPTPNINTVSLKNSTKKLNLPRRESFLIKDKIFFKKKSNWIWLGLKRRLLGFPKIIINLFGWTKNLNRKNRLLSIILIIVLAIFLLSLLITNINNRRREARQNFNDLVSQVEEKQNLVDSHLLYDDEEGAKIVLADVQTLLASLPTKRKDQREIHARLTDKLNSQEEKIQKLVKVEEIEEVANLSGLNINNLIWANNKIYSSNANTVYEVEPGSESSVKNELTASNLTRPYFDGKDKIYYWDNNKIVQFNIKTKESINFDINSLDESPATNFRIFNNNLYVLVKDKNQIQRYNRAGSSFGSKVDWLKGGADFSQATDLAIDGNIYVLNNTGEVIKLYKGQVAEYKASPIFPAMTSANKLFVGNDYLYILDRNSKRIAVLDKKTGQLMNQYQIDSLQQPRDFAINEAEKEAYLLDSELIYRIKLK